MKRFPELIGFLLGMITYFVFREQINDFLMALLPLFSEFLQRTR